MKAYGHSRKDKDTCQFGCCTTKSGKHKNDRDAVDRQNRKSARQAAKKEIQEQKSNDYMVHSLDS